MTFADIRHKHPQVLSRHPDTQGFVFNHTMLRVKDVTRSLAFYNQVLGYQLVDRRDFPDSSFSLYFLAILPDGTPIPENDAERRTWLAAQQGILELTHNYGTENDPEFAYHNGNADPRGFGHTCISVPDIQAACARFEALGVDFQKRLSDGRMKDIAFIKDPDGYWIEIISNT